MRLSILAVLAALYRCQPALANTCTDRDRLTGFLSEKYDEEPIAIGMIDRSGVMEVYLSEGGSWTIVVTSANGLSCVIAAGKAWEDLEPHYATEGDES